MKKAINFLLYFTVLFLVEAILLCTFSIVKHYWDFKTMNSVIVKLSFRNSIDITLLRLVFYSIIYFPAFLFFKRRLKNVVLIMLVNSALYILISLLFGLFVPYTRDYLARDFFYLTILATFISPWILKLLRLDLKYVTSKVGVNEELLDN